MKMPEIQNTNDIIDLHPYLYKMYINGNINYDLYPYLYKMYINKCG